jgi:hypothetical protein
MTAKAMMVKTAAALPAGEIELQWNSSHRVVAATARAASHISATFGVMRM